jgi:hypothetical protein
MRLQGRTGQGRTTLLLAALLVAIVIIGAAYLLMGNR